MTKDPTPKDPAADPDEAIEIPIDGVLDLHTFHPREIKDLVPEYLAECQKRGILQVRIIHGKVRYRTADLGGGGWGSTEVELKP